MAYLQITAPAQHLYGVLQCYLIGASQTDSG